MIEKSQLSDFQNNPSHVGSQKSIERQFMEHSESDLKFLSVLTTFAIPKAYNFILLVW